MRPVRSRLQSNDTMFGSLAGLCKDMSKLATPPRSAIAASNGMRRREFLYGAAVSGLLYGCGGGGRGSSASGPTTSDLAEFQVDTGGILHGIFYRGSNLTAGKGRYAKGGYYIIGGCFKNGVALDDQDNINSQSFRSGGALGINEEHEFGGELINGVCVGPTYQVFIKRTGQLVVKSIVTINPLPGPLASLSLPLDLSKDLFQRYRTSSGASGLYRDIPLTVTNPDGYRIGFRHFGPLTWLEARSDSLGIAVRRTVFGGSYASARVYYHGGADEGTNNLELEFGREIPARSKFRLEEEIRIIPQ